MMSSPLPTLAICVSYAYVVKRLGPRLMENRKPFSLRRTLIAYNLFQTVFSAWIFYEYLQSGWWGSYSFRCQPVDYTDSPMAMRMARTCWWYYFSKFTEFFDTFFFVLRKKNDHVSTLHVIHHGCMPFSVWMGMKFAPGEYPRREMAARVTNPTTFPGGHSTFFALLNTFVHVVMYFYYMVSAMGPRYHKYIWWKKYLTTLQIVQFIMIMTHQFQLLFTECNYPKSFMVWIGLHGVLFLFLFSDFYRASYRNGTRKSKQNGFCMVRRVDRRVGSFLTSFPFQPVNTGEDSRKNGTSLNGTAYLSTEYSNLKACYSNGVNNGFVTLPQSNGKKID